MTTIITGYHYDIGGREIYEDRVGAEEITTAGGLKLIVAVVADGVGGENQGERAAQLAKDAVLAYIRRGSEQEVPALLENAVQEANRQVYEEFKDTRGPSTTLALAAVLDEKDGDTLYVANVGDSRIYLCRNDKLTQLTIDHTFATIMPWRDKLSVEAAREHRSADVLMRALGPKPEVTVDVGFYVSTKDPARARERGLKGLPLREEGDSILVCSDGLIGPSKVTGEPFTKEEEIVQVLTTQEGTKAARSLVSFALGRNVDDNVSVALLQTPDPERSDSAVVPWLKYGIIGGAAIIALLLLFFTINQVRESNEAEAVTATAVYMAEVAAAAEATETVAAVEQAETMRLTEVAQQNMAATATKEFEFSEGTREVQELAVSAAMTLEAEAIMATAEAEVEAEDATRTYVETECLRVDNYNYELAGEPLLVPPAPYPYVAGSAPPPISASWAIVNTGQCPLTGLQLRSLAGGEGFILPELSRDGALLPALEPGDGAELTLNFSPTEAQTIDANWILIAASEGGDINLLDLPNFTLQVDPWITIISPSPTPTDTPRPTPTEEPTPEPPSPGRGGRKPPGGRG